MFQTIVLIKSLAEQGLTVSQIEAKTGIKAQQIKRLATKENITVEFENAYGFFRIKGNNQNCYIKSITITAESN